MKMTPTTTETPLRRSEVGVFRDVAQSVTVNDDEEERRQARRRTLLSSTVTDSSTIEESETLKKCLEIYNGNKLSRDNAWSLSLIDTLSTLLDRHHKSLNNFKVAGSSLEASSKVYGLRVDSVHTDVLRMSAGLNAQKFTETNLQDDDDDDGVATGGEGNANPNSSAGGETEFAGEKQQKTQKVKPKRQRRIVSTITKNKETLNARLDTVPLQDPVFGKLNTIVGSTNSSNRLMNNILLTTDSELRLRTNFRFWDATTLEKRDYTEEYTEESPDILPCDRLLNLERYGELHLRPLHGGYIISDMPEVIPEDKDQRRFSMDSNFDADDGGGGGSAGGGDGGDGGSSNFHNPNEMSMAFDINAECEPVPMLSEQMPVVDVDFGDFDDLTTDERTAINNCRGLRKAPVIIEDLRPVDASSKLEYSYRPLDKISQFWAGPSHWKFRRVHNRPSTISTADDQSVGVGRALQQPRGRRAQILQSKKRSKLNFDEIHDDLFIKLDDKYKTRKINVQKKWDQRKLKLPTDLQMDPEMFNKYAFAPGIPVKYVDEQHTVTSNIDVDLQHNEGDATSESLPTEHHFDDHFADADDGNFMNVSSTDQIDNSMANQTLRESESIDGVDNAPNTTVLEIATDYEGAPSQVTKIIVPFAKRAKVIDMKNLKRCCTQLISKQLKRSVAEPDIAKLPKVRKENYAPGIASFQEIYKELPSVLTQAMAESLSPSIAFYSVLHLANDLNLRLLPQEDLLDFKIRKIID